MKPYNHVDQRLHWLCQIIAKSNRTFVPKKEDDSHTNLYYDPLGNRITGRWIKTNTRRLIFTLNLENLHFEILESSQKVVMAVPSMGLKTSEIEEEIVRHLPSLGLTESGFSNELHYKISDYEFANQPIQSIEEKDMNEWKHYRQLANEVCHLLLGYVQVWDEIRIWPHHFDTGIYVMVNDDLGLGFGLAMEDEMVGEPYFYMTGYPKIGTIRYDNLPEEKEWRWELGGDWEGAILPIGKLKNKIRSEQMLIIKDYLTKNYKWFVNQ